MVYETRRKPGLLESGDIAPDMRYDDYTKEEILNIQQNGIGFSFDEFQTGGIEYIDADSLFMQFEDMCTSVFTDDEMGDVVREMIDHFRDGTGSNYSNSILTERAREHPSTKAYADTMLKQLKRGLAINNGDISIITPDYWREKLKQGYRPNYSSWSDILSGLTITINDTWSNSIEVENYTLMEKIIVEQ